MSSSALPSDLIRQLRDRFSLSRSGITLSAEEVSQLLKNLRTLEEIARETEEDNALYQLQIANRRKPVIIDVSAENVIRLPSRLRLVSPAPGSGGDAA